MPYVGDDVHRATKRKWDHDGNEAFRFSHPVPGATVFHILNQQAAPEGVDGISTRKTLPSTKRCRTVHDDTDAHAYGHGDIHSSHRRHAPCELAATIQGNHASNTSKVPLKTSGMVLMPCHVCRRRPTKKSDLDSFARCQSCHEQTCFVCIRECQGRNSNESPVPLLSEEEEEALSRSCHMDDADEYATPPRPNTDTQQRNSDATERGGMSARGPANSSIHHAMICSRCCVEEGAEGEVVCLGCLSNMDTA
ncbi:hypothetical protein V8C37DRAFT_390180 [Trichoderma ceciliae]